MEPVYLLHHRLGGVNLIDIADRGVCMSHFPICYAVAGCKYDFDHVWYTLKRCKYEQVLLVIFFRKHWRLVVLKRTVRLTGYDCITYFLMSRGRFVRYL